SPLSVAPSLPAEVRAAAAAESARGGTSVRANEVRRPTKFPNRTHGKAFFTIPGQGDFVCSASVVRSPSRSLVWTAGHCVYDRGFVRRWVFVPAYRNGKRPYGVWPARKLASTPQWKRSSALKYDLGAARVAKRGGGGDIQRRTGARGIAFNRDVPQRLDAFGYPAESNTQTNQDFDGQRPYRCDSRAKGRENPPGRGPKTIRIGCDMTAGASGGGWVNARGLVLSVSSYVRERGTNTELYGPYMGEIAKDLYQRMAKRG
ncbi:MAG: trypsin-like serine protease, partial [Solirubrobacterales bacterium]|nr:trypsin-like serine protease [Solirubrobacterales bacterium]